LTVVGADPVAVAVVVLFLVYIGMRIMTNAIGHLDRYLHH
jgi:hypothetical protein